MLEIISNNIAATVATIGLCIYFFGTALVFIISPLKHAEANLKTKQALRKLEFITAEFLLR